MFCPTCGARNTVGERFCRTCRTDLADPTAPSDVWAVAAPTDPPYDEFPVDPDPTIATTVVAPLTPPLVPPGGSPIGPPTALVRRTPPGPRRSFMGPLLGVVALGLVAVGIAFLVASNQNGDDTSSATSVQRTTASLSPDATALTTVAPSPDSTATPVTAVTPTSVPTTTTVWPTTVPPVTDPPVTDPPVTDPPVTDPPTTPATAPPTVPPTAAPTPNAVALAQLTTWAAQDTPIVEDVVGMWVPQVGAKKIGTKDDGIVYTLPDIALNHQQFRDDLGAVLVDSGEYVFKVDNLWVSIIPVGFVTSAGALDWCADHDLGPSDCFAKLITHDDSIKVTTAYQ